MLSQKYVKILHYMVAIPPKKSSENKLEDSEETKNIVLTVYIP